MMDSSGFEAAFKMIGVLIVFAIIIAFALGAWIF